MQQCQSLLYFIYWSLGHVLLGADAYGRNLNMFLPKNVWYIRRTK